MNKDEFAPLKDDGVVVRTPRLLYAILGLLVVLGVISMGLSGFLVYDSKFAHHKAAPTNSTNGTLW